MRKVLSFSLFLMLGLVASQLLPGALGTAYPGFKATADTLLYICLGFIMINVGREFEIDKSRWQCNSCHVPQIDAKPLVENVFKGNTAAK